MSAGVKAVRYLLAQNAPLTAVVRDDEIMAGPLPQGIPMPAISVKQVSRVEPQMVDARGGLVQYRVQVTVMASRYPQLRQVLDLVRAALPRTRGTVSGISVDALIPDTEGPDFADEESGIFFGSHDFMVTCAE